MSATGASATAEAGATRAITSRRVLLIAAPVVLSNATVPLHGAIDTAIIGNLGRVEALAAVGLGAELFALLFSSCNFLQIGVSGLSAQALGAGLKERVAHTLLRGFMVAAALSVAMILLQAPLLALGLSIFEASAETETLAGRYFSVRIWGAPAELANYAVLGWFTGQEMTRRLFQHQLALATMNVGFNLLLVIGLGWGVEGVALSTALAAYLGLGYGLWLARRRAAMILPPSWRPVRARLLNREQLRGMIALNRDVFIRTLLLVGSFAWMARLGSLQGDAILAANVVLLQFFHVSAYALDGFAMAAETLVGQSIGARDPRRLDKAVWLTTLWSGLLSLAISAIFIVLSGPIIDLFTTAPEIRSLARDYALWAAAIPAVGFLAFQMDGVFVGATGSRQMRNAMILTALVYLPLSLALAERYGNHGIWAAVWIWLGLRALTLLALYPAIRAKAMLARESD